MTGVILVYAFSVLMLLVPLYLFWTIARDPKSMTRIAARWAMLVIVLIQLVIIGLIVHEML